MPEPWDDHALLAQYPSPFLSLTHTLMEIMNIEKQALSELVSKPFIVIIIIFSLSC